MEVDDDLKMTANMVTIARIVLMPIPGYMLYLGATPLFASIAVITVLGITDYIDGIMARREGPTVLGGLLDPIADKIFIAVIYLPLTERYVEGWDRTVIPMWMTMCIFCRDFLVTSLRTSMMLRDAPMRTSNLAKFKTAIQMVGIGYVVFYLALHLSSPDHWVVWIMLCAPPLIPLSLILYRLVTGKKQGVRSWSMLALMIVAIAIRCVFDANWTSYIMLTAITGLTVYSGLSYMVDAWSALKGKPGGIKEAGRFLLDGVLVPVSFLLVLGRYETWGVSAAIISTFSLELAAGGLANLLASNRIRPRFRWVLLKSALQFALFGSAFALWLFDVRPPVPFLGEGLILSGAAVTVMFAAISFWRHREVYIDQIRPSRVPAGAPAEE
jgi:cardiolipin synthase (CMP-forming)